MKISEITLGDICQQARIEPDMLDAAEEKLLTVMQDAAVDYVRSYTGLTEEEMDEHEDLTIAVLVLAADLYDNREMTVDKSNVNRVVETILGMHCRNLL
ncbi:MAG: head-tail connector protein [Eubacteriales bacterium]|nr:head-tail connector protein [Eubacteriales bacterium]